MAQPCDREEIGVQLQVAADGIDKANCSEFNDLQVALKELSKLLIEKADSQNASATATQNVNAVPAPATTQNVNAAPADAAQSVNAPDAAAAAQNANIMDTEMIPYNGGKTSTSYEKIKKMLNNTIVRETNEERKTKITRLLNQINEAKAAIDVQNIMNEFGNFTIKSSGSNAYYTIGINGGTRKRKNRRNRTQRKRAKTLKNKKNKAGKR